MRADLNPEQKNQSRGGAPALVQSKTIEELMNQLYGSNVIDYLSKRKDIGYRTYIHLHASYNNEVEKIDQIAQGAYDLAVSGKFTEFLRKLGQHLSRLASPRAEVYDGKENPNLHDLLKAQAREVFHQMQRAISKKPLSNEEKAKIAKSVIYAIAALQSPLNPDLSNKLIENADQTVGVSSRLKNFYGALSLLAFTAIVVFSIVGIPFTGGVSLLLGFAVGGSLLLATSAAGFFYSGREKSVARGMRQLGESLKDYQEGHERELKANSSPRSGAS